MNEQVPMVAWLVPLIVFGSVFLIVAAALYAGFRKDRHRHETLRAMIEKGVSIPPELLIPPRGSDLRKGLVLAGAGLGITLCVVAMPDTRQLWGLGAVPALIGLGYLAAWRFERAKA